MPLSGFAAAIFAAVIVMPLYLAGTSTGTLHYGNPAMVGKVARSTDGNHR